MKNEIPAFLMEMSKQLNEQDNRCTAEPIWVVCYDDWLTCADDRGDKEIMLLSDDCDYIECEIEDYTEIFDHLKECHEDWCWSIIKEYDEEEDDIDEISNYFDPDETWRNKLPEGVEIEKLAMQKVVHKVRYCLTEADASAFIKRKQHDYKKLYTYVESMHHCPQMVELRNWIKNLAVI